MAQSGKPAAGRAASGPSKMPWSGWKDIAWRVKDAMARDNMSLVAGGVAFFALLALFPALAAMVALYGLIASPQDVARQTEAISGMLPDEAQGIVEMQLSSAAESSAGAMGVGALIGLAFALWSASKGTKNMIVAINIAYEENDERGFVRGNLLALGLTLGALVLVIVAVGLIAVVPAVLALIDLGTVWDWVLRLVRWPILFGIALFGMAVLYRLAPDRPPPGWRWASPGAVIGTLVWILGSLAFSIYVGRFGDYNATYGVLAGVVILMLWLYISAMSVLLGAEINVELERQTRHDTTGQDRPLGARGAHAADTLGPSRHDEK